MLNPTLKKTFDILKHCETLPFAYVRFGFIVQSTDEKSLSTSDKQAGITNRPRATDAGFGNGDIRSPQKWDSSTGRVRNAASPPFLCPIQREVAPLAPVLSTAAPLPRAPVIGEIGDLNSENVL